ncbi:hypothetical protein [Chryseoglobus sp. 28M-23]|uniref:hypothetical protein n=1 Tax=Chryseoglobus sp. 28M-23 TaxID=2772253 RepID=UPI001746AD48|nr:hypothetical protein [Chryseoglobus sp. 28M-23]QOD94241.1 hypothetical protein IE160_03135 [Chryseoglobus sp. 28M-23]
MSLREHFDDRSMGLANLLFEYDLLGVYHSVFRPEDDEEYDDLVGTLREGLESGQSPADLSAVFATALRDRYGLDSATSEAELPFIEKVHAWWRDQAS